MYKITEIINDTIPSYKIDNLKERYNESLLKKTELTMKENNAGGTVSSDAAMARTVHWARAVFVKFYVNIIFYARRKGEAQRAEQ